MGKLNDWKKVLDGGFIGRIALAKWYIYDQGEYIRYLLHDKQGSIWHIHERFGANHTTTLEKTKLNDNVAIDEVKFWVRPYRTHGLNITILGRGKDQRLYIYDDAGIDRWELLDENGRFPANGLGNGDALTGRGVNNNVWVGRTPHAESRDVHWENLGGDVRGRPSIVDGTMLLAVDGNTQIIFNVITPRERDIAYSGWMAMMRSSFAEDPLLVRLPDPAGVDRVMMFGHGTPEHHLWSREWISGTGWGRWHDHNKATTPLAEIKGNPAIVQVAQRDQLFCFVRGKDDALWCLPYKDNHWQTWQRWGGELAEDPVAVMHGAVAPDGRSWITRLRAFAIGTDGGLWERSYEFSADEIS